MLGFGRRFRDRVEAGRALAMRLAELAGPDLVVLGLPRGGVVVAAEVAAALGGALDIVVVRKVGVPGRPELAMGAVAAAGEELETVRDARVLASAAVDEATFERARSQELVELRRREDAYRQGRPPMPLTGRRVVLVDDGLATGSTMRAAVAAVRREKPARLVAAVPVGSPAACAALATEVDEVACLWAPGSFRAVGQAYDDFRPTTDDEVREALARAG
ncbi:phosphoribosyltransferase family protein [Blastococcus sp. CCUG 61487]|uniref:phosphoribosyltransferase n=1 Tax=Blastococcus sp. CCUG 61487 TaxID=1840703 RepID=UPI00201DCE75|nr:phosphoribosyltransferase family protein [Blastococcus sp. CCUG 61487]